MFCEECVSRLVGLGQSCPLCRTDIADAERATFREVENNRPQIITAHQIIDWMNRRQLEQPPVQPTRTTLETNILTSPLLLPGAGSRSYYAPVPTEPPLERVIEHLPWWPVDHHVETTETYLHSRARLPHGRRGLLVDTGAYDNLTGASWVREQAADAAQAGFSVKQERLSRPTNVMGVGHGSMSCNFKVTVPTSSTDIDGKCYNDDFTTPVMDGEAAGENPALLGLKTLRRLKAVIDCGNDLFYVPGPGGIKLQQSPGTRVHRMETSLSGHLMLPINDFKSKTKRETSSLHLATEQTLRQPTYPTTTGGSSSSSSGMRLQSDGKQRPGKRDAPPEP